MLILHLYHILTFNLSRDKLMIMHLLLFLLVSTISPLLMDLLFLLSILYLSLRGNIPYHQVH